ncbi:hypothetical protein K443DRAFT_561618 [Laccaria amethystina LaAM-08-1]|uniref:Uncharacterized protein n=1 Tax=Laccaria amethystina LaAM-08-1 TaxID=1095629 RepID=A0A0C9YDS1_9AGAR|nr:hypothetical protein K443DRAFT_561618 [Laccaria amethystina LaAM-08-1]
MWGVYRDYYLHERIPKTPFSKQACIDREFSIRITLPPGVPSGQSSQRVPFLLGCTPRMCVLRDVVLLVLLCRSGKQLFLIQGARVSGSA